MRFLAARRCMFRARSANPIVRPRSNTPTGCADAGGTCRSRRPAFRSATVGSSTLRARAFFAKMAVFGQWPKSFAGRGALTSIPTRRCETCSMWSCMSLRTPQVACGVSTAPTDRAVTGFAILCGVNFASRAAVKSLKCYAGLPMAGKRRVCVLVQGSDYTAGWIHKRLSCSRERRGHL